MGRGAFDQLTRQIIGYRSGGICERCLIQRAEQQHHRTPRQAGGSRSRWISSPSNGVAVCLPCHAWIERCREAAEAAGWLVPRGVAEQAGGNAAVPIADVLGRLWLLDDHGGKILTRRVDSV